MARIIKYISIFLKSGVKEYISKYLANPVITEYSRFNKVYYYVYGYVQRRYLVKKESKGISTNCEVYSSHRKV